jgi:hypothetical protein
MKIMKKIYIFLLMGVCSLSLQAQQNDRKDTVSLSREMTLEREYNPTIKDAVKMNQLPELREPQAPKSKVEYSNYAVPFGFKPELTVLKPQTWFSDLHTSKYKGYLTAGVSTLADINADAGYQILNTTDNLLNLYFSHRSSNSRVSSLQVDTTQKFKINDNWGGLNFSHDFGKVRLNTDVKYTLSMFNYSELTISNWEDIRLSSARSPQNIDFVTLSHPSQTDNLFEAHVGLSSDKPNTLNYNVNAKYTFFKHKYGINTTMPGVKENRVIIDWDFHNNINSTSGFGLGGYLKHYAYTSSIDFKTINDGLISYSAFSINPYYYLEGDNLNLLLGVKADFEIGGRKKNIVAPTIRFNYYFGDRVQFYLITDGGRKDNSNYEMFYENRYIYPLAKIWDARSPFDGTVGLKFLPLSELSLDIFAGYEIIRDEHYFIPRFGSPTNNPTSRNLSNLFLYPDFGDEEIAKLGARISCYLSGNFEFDLKGTYYHRNAETIVTSYDGGKMFTTKVPSEPWHKPQFEALLNTAYRLPALPLRLNLSYRGLYGRKTTAPFISNTGMKDIHDLSAKATYTFSPAFSAYLSVNNLLFQKYDIWYGHPAQNFNIIGGISFLF